jgi:choline dehydrogenase-like flavoprotein
MTDVAAPFVPDDPAAGPWDAIVVGTGMGGATVGYGLAALGRRVLFLERGRSLHGPGAGAAPGPSMERAGHRPDARLRSGLWPDRVEGRTSFGTLDFLPPIGCGTGGSTAIYAGQLERLAPVDFEPGANFPGVRGASLPARWPISHAELVPYYRRAEALFRVAGTPDPLNPDPGARLREPPPLGPRDQDLADSFRELGLHPYRAHTGFELVPGCDGCGGTVCPRRCRSDAGRICLVPALEHHGARLLAECQVLRLEADASAVRAVRCRWRGRELSLPARIVVLAAGALMTPGLLLDSRSPDWPDGLANRSGCVGRHLMFHPSDLVAVSPRRPAPSPAGPGKALALNDFYVSDGQKLGTFQSAGIDRARLLHYLPTAAGRATRWQRRPVGPLRPLLRLAARAGARALRDTAVFATIVEDLPYRDNRIVPDRRAGRGMRFEYRYPDELRARTAAFRTRLAAVLGRHHRVAILTGENNLNYSHACGTCRFGDDPATSVLDRNSRAHDVLNLYVADASFFPSSGGTNPGLTIAANALRVAEAIDRQLAAG